MSEQIGYSVDRSGWAAGPWDTESDREEWRAHGMACLAVRNAAGAWCGYVGVPPGHPHHSKPYRDVNAKVHGGLTYSDKCREHICHVPQPGEPDAVWWLGFDCNHAFDKAPGVTHEMRQFAELFGALLGEPMCPSGPEGYKTIGYVRAEVERLAEQMAQAANA